MLNRTYDLRLRNDFKMSVNTKQMVKLVRHVCEWFDDSLPMMNPDNFDCMLKLTGEMKEALKRNLEMPLDGYASMAEHAREHRRDLLEEPDMDWNNYWSFEAWNIFSRLARLMGACAIACWDSNEENWHIINPLIKVALEETIWSLASAKSLVEIAKNDPAFCLKKRTACAPMTEEISSVILSKDISFDPLLEDLRYKLTSA